MSRKSGMQKVACLRAGLVAEAVTLVVARQLLHQDVDLLRKLHAPTVGVFFSKFTGTSWANLSSLSHRNSRSSVIAGALSLIRSKRLAGNGLLLP